MIHTRLRVQSGAECPISERIGTIGFFALTLTFLSFAYRQCPNII